MHHRTSPLCAILSLSLLPALEAQMTKVIPAANATVEGSRSTVYPFGYVYNRSQQIWDGSAVTGSTALLYGFKYRPDATPTTLAMAARTYPNATVSIGPTTVSPLSMSTTFASNVTSPLTKVVNAGTLSLPAQPAPPPVSPGPFNISVSWTAPLIFSSATSHLILDISLPGGAAKSQYFLDGEYATTGAQGTVRPFGTSGSFSSPEVFSLSANAATLAPGGTFDVTCGKLSKAYGGALIIGLSDKNWSGTSLPLDLVLIGAPKNSLYVSMDLQLPFNAVMAGPSAQSAFKTTIPSQPVYQGLTFYTQAYYADSKANGAGLVATHALALTTANASAGPVTNMIGNFLYTSATGRFVMGLGKYGGPIIQFNGVLP